LTRKAKRSGREIELTDSKYALLEYFVRNVNQVLTRTVISEHICEYNFDTGTNKAEVYVNNLRNKIDSDSERKLIHTVQSACDIMKID
jgi:DNA-binding response OmpR family regulator